MSWVATAVVGGAVVGGVTSVIGAGEQSDAAKQAAQTSADAARYQTDIQKQIYDQARADQTPWRTTGSRALDQLAQLTGLGSLAPSQTTTGGSLTLGPAPTGQVTPQSILQMIGRPKITFGTSAAATAAPSATTPAADPGTAALLRPFSMADFQADPGYAFRQSQGLQALDRSAAARGGALSGAAIKASERFGQGLASEEYSNAFNRYQTNQGNIFNRLAALAGVGQTANAQSQQAGSNYANAVTGISQADSTNQGNALLAAGNARASGYQGVGNALGGLGGNLALLKYLNK